MLKVFYKIDVVYKYKGGYNDQTKWGAGGALGASEAGSQQQELLGGGQVPALQSRWAWGETLVTFPAPP